MTLTKRGTVVAVAVFTALALFTAACSSNKDTTSTGSTTGGTASSATTTQSLSGTLNGSGSTFQKAFYEDGHRRLRRRRPERHRQLRRRRLRQGQDRPRHPGRRSGPAPTAPIKDDDLATFKGGTVLYFPTVAAPITVSYNLSGVSELQLSPDTLAKIFQAQITTWNDPAIAADNPGATLPSTPIVVVHRSDGSGTTSNFTKYLKAAAPSTWTLDAGDTVNWPTSTQAGNGNAGVAQIIKDTDGAIGYVDLSDAKASKPRLRLDQEQGRQATSPRRSTARPRRSPAPR